MPPFMPFPLLLALVVNLQIDPHPAARFDPRTALGGTIDVHGSGENEDIFTRRNVEAMLSAGFQPLSYRLATELGGEAWHWNPSGTWSDPEHAQGYWTSSDTSAEPIDVSYGYRLPRRGNTISQSMNADYSRIDDGDVTTFWKSNPYVDPLPQWLLIDLGAVRTVDHIRIVWGEPYATDYAVQWWDGLEALDTPWNGEWIDLKTVHAGRGGDVTLPFAPATARYLRVLMITSSHTARGSDPRDRLGFAVSEVFVDGMRHAKSRDGQTVIWVSSTDPWHRAIDRDPSMEQIGFDALFHSGLTRGRPVLMPVSLMYGTPEDSAAEVRYLRSRGYAVRQIEMGEEPDGQNVSPEDYAALYRKWADAMHAVDPTLQLGGPAFQSTRDRIAFWADARGRTSWMGRFLDALRAANRLGDFNFFSFEWYPFDKVCDPVEPQLLDAPKILDKVLGWWRDDGVPESIPWLVTEYGWSSYPAEAEVSIVAALFNADFIGDFLAHGGAAAYFYSLEPDVLLRNRQCDATGNLLLFLSDEEHHIRHKLASYHAARMITHDWLQASGTHEIHRVLGTSERLSAFAVRRPDGTWAMLLINKDDKRAQRVRFRGKLEVTQLSPREYVWDATLRRPARNSGPRRFTARDEVELPAWSVTVLRIGERASGPQRSGLRPDR